MSLHQSEEPFLACNSGLFEQVLTASDQDAMVDYFGGVDGGLQVGIAERD